MPRAARSWTLGNRTDRLTNERRADPAPPPPGSATDRHGRPVPGMRDAVLGRMRGPGGYYNVGNALALGTGLGVQIAATVGGGQKGAVSILDAVRTYLVGSPGATALTAAILIFMVSGEMYHRAWSRGAPPDQRLNEWGDLLSGMAAVVLTISLVDFGNTLLALTSGLLLAGGKFGSALVPESCPPHAVSRWPKRFRFAVVASRLPALISLTVGLAGLIAIPGAAPLDDLVLTPVMLVCYLLWTRADLLLMQPRPAAADTGRNEPRTARGDASA